MPKSVLAITATAAAAITFASSAHARVDTPGGNNGPSINGLSINGILPNGVDPNGISLNGWANGINANGITANALGANGTVPAATTFAIDGIELPAQAR